MPRKRSKVFYVGFSDHGNLCAPAEDRWIDIMVAKLDQDGKVNPQYLDFSYRGFLAADYDVLQPFGNISTYEVINSLRRPRQPVLNALFQCQRWGFKEFMSREFFELIRFNKRRK